MALSDAISSMVTILGAMSGIQRAYTNPPESIDEFPALLVYAGPSEMEFMPGGYKAIHTIIVEVRHSRQVLPAAVDAAKVWPDRLMAAIRTEMGSAGTQFGGYVTAIAGPITATPGAYGYNQETHYGVRFEVPIKVII